MCSRSRLFVLIFSFLLPVTAVSVRQRSLTSALVGVEAKNESQNKSSGNPWGSGGSFSSYMSKFNIPSQHGSGIKVDLGGDAGDYRLSVGKCPVFGKYIKLKQPSTAVYRNNFLDDTPASDNGTPLSGGFNNNMVVQSSGRKYSPVDDSFLVPIVPSSLSHPISRCAHYATNTIPLDPKTNTQLSSYKYPFVYDTNSKKCYVLSITMQSLRGDKYCSTSGQPSGLKWYCFEPQRDQSNKHLVYGSSFLRSDWITACPSSAVRNALFGSWVNGECVPFKENAPKVISVTSKEQCWTEVFSSSSDDSPTTYPEGSQSSWNDWWPVHGQSRPKSNGHGNNWANFFINRNGLYSCAIFSTIPNCFSASTGSVAYTALGDINEENLPNCTTTTFPEVVGKCYKLSSTVCKEDVQSCVNNQIVNSSRDCDCAIAITPPGGKEDEGGVPVAAIAGGIIGGLLLLALIGGGAFYYSKKSGDASSAGAKSDFAPTTDGGADKHRVSDIAANPENSFWQDSPGNAKETPPPIDAEYSR